MFQANPVSMAVELQVNVLARLDEAMVQIKLARRELIQANRLIETKKAG